MSEKHLALHNQHVELGAKMVPFAGFMMPIQYSGIIDEHLAVRRNVGIFDVSHMGEFEIRGSDAEKWLNRMTVNNVAKLEPGNIQYSAMLYDDGGVVDDLLVYRFKDHYITVVNAANIQKDFDWFKSHLKGDVRLTDISDSISLLAIQGPKAKELVQKITDTKLDEIVYYNFREGKAGGVPAWVSRTGYTGEDGFELYVRQEYSTALWDAVWKVGKPMNLKPIGLGARDSLRLEVAYCLYGNDIDKTTNPIEAGLGWIVKSKKPGGFIGLDTVLKAKEGTTRTLMGFIPEGRAIPRHGMEIYARDKKIGVVTSGGFAPAVDKPVGLGYIDKPYDIIGGKVELDMRGKRIPAEIVTIPFYKRQ
jgi:aminomethyltransferase